ncbi:MAG: electron transport complex subunit RsxD [Gammaproteobacteria bacterium]|nr:MAG: electron transport complex subunit RsxD [Gammaproteobacteria bacterium]
MTAFRHSPLAAPSLTVQIVMRRVLLAMVPGIMAYTWFFGWGLFIQLGITTVTALGFEALMLKLRKRPIAQHLNDYSALVTAWLLAVCIPPLTPWWITITAVLFAIVIAKHLYGGLGYNPFNPAMIGYAVLLVSFPREMTMWLPPAGESMSPFGFVDTLSIVFTGSVVEQLDGISTATPLDHFKFSTAAAPDIMGFVGGRGWEWISLAWLVGGLWLAFKQVIDWRIPLSLLATVAVFSVVLSLFTSNPAWQDPLFHIVSGGVMLAAFFIATDPVTASTTPRGRLIYGAGIGFLAITIRLWGGYPDGFCFAVLLMNLAAPLIDYLTIPRAYGHEQ